MYIRRHVKYPLFLSDLNETLIFTIDFGEKKNSNIKFHENLSSGKSCYVGTGGRTDGRTCITKLAVAFRNSANASLNNTFLNSFISLEVGLI